jgi:PEP-CTERM/exosortase A-associated glycosyltransferase
MVQAKRWKKAVNRKMKTEFVDEKNQTVALLPSVAGCERMGDATRVLHVLDHSLPLLSGYSIRSHNLISAQRLIGFAAEVVTGPLHQMEDPKAADVSIDEICYRRTTMAEGLHKNVIERRVPILREMAVVQRLRRRVLECLDSQTFDIVHAHSPALCGLAALQAATARGIPFVYEVRAFWEDAAVDQKKTKVHSARYEISRRLERYVALRANAVVGISRHILEDLTERGVDPDKLFHVPNGVDAARFTPLPRDARLAAELGLGSDPVLGFIGSLYRYEGLAWMLRASSQLRRQGVPFQILIVGQGEEMPDIQDAIREVGAQGYVRIAGQVPHDQIRRYYSLMDVMVYPRRSVRLTELTTPLKPLEAMAQAKAVIASDVGGTRELVGPEWPCLLFKPDDVDEYCRQARQLICDERFRRDLGERARQMILREKDWNVQARRYEAVYALAKNGRRALRRDSQTLPRPAQILSKRSR